MCDPRIIARKLGSEICTLKSLKGPNPFFMHNIHVYMIMRKCSRNHTLRP